MTSFISDTDDHTSSNGPEPSAMDTPLGWEGHVHCPEGSPLWSKLLGNWPELRTGLAFSLVFVVGGLLGGSLTALLCCNRQKSGSDHT